MHFHFSILDIMFFFIWSFRVEEIIGALDGVDRTDRDDTTLS